MREDNLKRLIPRVALGDQKAFDEIYLSLKEQFLSLMTKHEGLDREGALDLYQEACAALYNNILSGRLTEASLTGVLLSTYLNQVGRYTLYNMRRKRQTPLVFDTEMVLSFDSEAEPQYDPVQDEKIRIVVDVVNKMEMPCSMILNLFYFRKKSQEEVARIMSYSNADSAKTQKSKCMKKLRAAVKQKFRESGYDE